MRTSCKLFVVTIHVKFCKKKLLQTSCKYNCQLATPSRTNNPEKLETLGTQDKERRHGKQKNTTQKIKTMSNTDPSGGKIRCPRTTSSPYLRKDTSHVTHIVKDKQPLPPTRHQPCYSYSQYLLDATIRKQTQIA